MATPRIAAVMGFGRFGKALVDLCAEARMEVRAHDVRPGIVPPEFSRPDLRALVTGADVVVVAVPVPAMETALRELLPHLTPEQLVLDVGSVKTVPEAALEAVLGDHIPWIATHPLFGPMSLALGDRPLRVVVCPNARHPGALARAREFYERVGCEIIEQAADAHDRAMADTHALAFFVAKGLLDVRAGEGVPFTPPSFQAIARTIESVRSDAGHLFLAIQRENPYAGAARRRLLDALSNVDEQLRAMGATPPSAAPGLTIPDLGAQSPDLKAARDLIDEIDQHLVDLLARRAQLARRAGRAKAEQGQVVRDPERERVLLETRSAWARERALDPDAVREVFEAIMRLSRALQRADLAG